MGHIDTHAMVGSVHPHGQSGVRNAAQRTLSAGSGHTCQEPLQELPSFLCCFLRWHGVLSPGSAAIPGYPFPCWCTVTLGNDEKVLEMDSCDGYITLQIHLASLRMIKLVNLPLCVFL